MMAPWIGRPVSALRWSATTIVKAWQITDDARYGDEGLERAEPLPQSL